MKTNSHSDSRFIDKVLGGRRSEYRSQKPLHTVVQKFEELITPSNNFLRWIDTVGNVSIVNENAYIFDIAWKWYGRGMSFVTSHAIGSLKYDSFTNETIVSGHIQSDFKIFWLFGAVIIIDIVFSLLNSHSSADQDNLAFVGIFLLALIGFMFLMIIDSNRRLKNLIRKALMD
jgi:hypothetical protein